MSANRARTRAIRERMARTGEPYTLAARMHDQERATQRDEVPANEHARYGHVTEVPDVRNAEPPTKPAAALNLPFVAPPDQPDA